MASVDTPRYTAMVIQETTLKPFLLAAVSLTMFGCADAATSSCPDAASMAFPMHSDGASDDGGAGPIHDDTSDDGGAEPIHDDTSDDGGAGYFVATELPRIALPQPGMFSRLSDMWTQWRAARAARQGTNSVSASPSPSTMRSIELDADGGVQSLTDQFSDESTIGAAAPFRRGIRSASAPPRVVTITPEAEALAAWFVAFFGPQNQFTPAELATTTEIVSRIDAATFRRIVCHMSSPRASVRHRVNTLTTEFTRLILDTADFTRTDHIFLFDRTTELVAGYINTQFIDDNLIDIDIDGAPNSDPIAPRRYVSPRITESDIGRANRLVPLLTQYRAASEDIRERGRRLIEQLTALEPSAAGLLDDRFVGLGLPIARLTALIPIKHSYPTPEQPAPFFITYLYGVDFGHGTRVAKVSIDLSDVEAVTHDQASILLNLFATLKACVRFDDTEAQATVRYQTEAKRLFAAIQRELLLGDDEASVSETAFVQAATQIDRDTARFGIISEELWLRQCHPAPYALPAITEE